MIGGLDYGFPRARPTQRLDALGALPMSAEERMSVEVVNLMEFIPKGLRSAVKARTNTAELATYLQAGLTATRINGNPGNTGNAGKMLYVPAGKYKVSVAQTVGTGQFVFFDPYVEIDARALPTENTNLFEVSNQTDVSFEGNGATVVGALDIAVSGASWNGAAFFIYGSDNVTVRNFKVQKFSGTAWVLWGDDTGSGPSQNCVIERIEADQCGRNGGEVISAKSCTIIGGIYKRTGTVRASPGGPWAGIDIEPNSDNYCENVTLLNVGSYQNAGAGIQVTPGGMSSVTGKKFFVNILGGMSEEDGDTVGVAGLYFINGGAQTNKIYGRVQVEGYTIKNPHCNGIRVYNWDADKCPSVVLNDCSVYDPDYTSAAATNALRTAMQINADAACAVTNLGNVYVRNLFVEDTRAGGAIRMPWGVLLAASAGKKVKNVVMQDVRSVNYVAAAKGDVNTAVSATSILEDVYVTYTDGRPFSTGNTALDTMGGTVVRPNGSGGLYSLPAAAWCKGLAYIVENPIGTNGTTVSVTAGDTISWAVDVVSTNLVIDDGAKVTLTSDGLTGWKADIIGPYRKAGMAAAKKLWWAAAVPAAGTHVAGDRVFNSAPGVGTPKSWVCTVAGTPGTWVSEGNL